jgi:mannose-6-phosphate isomerase
MSYLYFKLQKLQMNRQGIYRLKGVIKNYDWGGTEFLSQLLSLSNAGGQPMAEYWLGTHHLASAEVKLGNERIPLTELIRSDKERILGASVAKKFGGLPYLLKVLDVKDMLSIQVHPAKHEAELGFAEENRKGIPLDAPNRNYRDDNHKPELIVALGDFWLLHGFKPVEKLRATLQSIPEFKTLREIFESTGYDQLYKTVMEMPQQSVNEILQPLLDRIIPLYKAGQLKKDEEHYWVARAAGTFNRAPDRGIFSIYFLNLLRIKKGEGVFQDAGILHAYLEGQNIEIMASSDNVLRGGLTSKHVDVKELMKHVKFEETVPRIIRPAKHNNEEVYVTAAPDFKLSRIELEPGQTTSFHSVTGEMLLVIEGAVSLNDQITLNRGESAFIESHQQPTIKALSKAGVFRASVPVHSGE